ncbi:MAG: hypothetical protein KJ811_03100 [Candidatus Margulisbacteria bacterium]|nr:hypothetical protein [Candidatus Margulisiibacteriota bacterium]
MNLNRKGIRRWIKTFVLVVLLSVVCSAAVSPTKQEFKVQGGLVYLNLKDAEIKNVLQIFAQAIRANIVTADDVAGKVTVAFTGIPAREGLEAVLRSNGLNWFEDNGTIYVSKDMVMKTYYLENARPSDITGIITSILPADSKVSVDDSYNALVILASSDHILRVEKLIKDLDVSPTQVMIEVKMIEVRHNDGGTVGLDASYTSSADPQDAAQTYGFADRTLTQGFYAHILNGNIESYLSTLATTATYNTIATPRVTTISNKEATLLIGSKLGYKVTVVTETSTTQDIKFLEIGTSLKLTPYVSRSGNIRMIVEPKISDGTVNEDVPTENTTETKNEVVVKDGQTFVIGGLMKDKDTENNYGVPFIMDIPFIGGFFRRTVVSKEKQELLVFVTPHIMSAGVINSMDKDIGEMELKSKANKAKLIH